MVEEGSFRMDLLYRINTIQVEIPPLRERGDDILLLAAYFLHRFSGRYNKSGLKMDKSAENALRKWTWPGNVRELQHSMERAVILADGKIITERSFQFNTSPNSGSASFEGSLEEVESRLFQYAIRKHNGNMTAVAAQLGISRQTLYNKIKKYGL
jgi:transcriptional regulator with PAS, ATPase and Fis domain